MLSTILRALTRTTLVLVVVAWYIRRKFRMYIKTHYESIPLPSMEDYSEKTKSGLFYVLGASALTPGEQVDVFKKMGMPKYFKSRLLFIPTVMSTVKEDANIASTKRKALTYEVYRPFLGYHSIIFQEGAKARKEREMLNKGFGQQTYRSIHPVMVGATQRLIERMVKETERDGFCDVEQLLSRATLEVIAEGGFSFEVDKAENVIYLEALKRLMRIPGNPICLLPYGTELVQWWNRNSLDKVHELLDRTVTDRVNAAKMQMVTASDGPTDLLDLVIRASKMDGEEPNLIWIRDQINLLFIGGSDTSSVSLWWAMILLGRNPEIQAKVKSEIKDAFARVADPFDRISQLKYMDGFIKEVLRLYPPFITSGRRLNDDENEFRGFPISDRRRSIVGYTHLLAHRREEYFPNADTLDPDRWLNGRADTEAFGSFSTGFRSCLGKNFAMIEMKTVLGLVLENHTIVSVNPSAPLPMYGFVGQVATPVGKYDLRLVHDL